MKWEKLGQVFTINNKDKYLISHASNPLPIHLKGNIFRVLYSGRNKNNKSSVGFVDIDIMNKKIINYPSKPLIKYGDPNSFYSHGISIGNRLSAKEIEEVKAQIKAAPRQYVAQPIMSLSLHSTYIEDSGQFEPRHIDLRTFTLMGKNTNFVLKGGLSRVALTKGSLIVNSSQGGGSKDTWVIEN